MTLKKLAQWLTGEITRKEDDLSRVIERNKSMPLPDLISRRVIESELLSYRIVLRKIKEG